MELDILKAKVDGPLVGVCLDVLTESKTKVQSNLDNIPKAMVAECRLGATRDRYDKAKGDGFSQWGVLESGVLELLRVVLVKLSGCHPRGFAGVKAFLQKVGRGNTWTPPACLENHLSWILTL